MSDNNELFENSENKILESPKIPHIPEISKIPEDPKIPQTPSIPPANNTVNEYEVPDVSKQYNRSPSSESTKMAYTNEEVLRKIEAFVKGPVSAMPEIPKAEKPADGRGEVVDPKHDHRLKENKEKHDELAEQATESEQNAGDSESDSEMAHEEDDVKTPYVRERADHRAALESPFQNPGNVRIPNAPQLPKPEPVRTRTPGPLGKGLTPSNIDPSKLGTPMSALEKKLREHPHANKLLGPNAVPEGPEGIERLQKVIQKIHNMATVEQSRIKRNQLQKEASAVAAFLIRQML